MAAVNSGLKGFIGGFTDGRYGYFVPKSGTVARLDLLNFSQDGVTELALTAKDADLKGFYGGFTDGRYGYFVPNYPRDNVYGGKVARVDLQNFTLDGVNVLNLADKDADLIGFCGGFSDGRYAYFAPNTTGGDRIVGKVARVDVQNFTLGGVTVLDLTQADTNLIGFIGGFTDGHYGYFVPNYFGRGAFHGHVARVDLQNFTKDGVTALDLTQRDQDLKGFAGGFTDGRYGYFVPSALAPYAFNGKVARVDLQNFTTNGVSVLDLSTANQGLKGFVGGFTDGRYGYFVPWNDSSGTHGRVARVDLQSFTTGGVAWLDLSAADPDLKGFNGGFSDGRYGYFVPNYTGTKPSGKVARIQLFFGGGSP